MKILLLTSLASLSTILGGWVALRARRHIHLLLGFGAGVLLGATFFDLLPEAIEAAGPRGWTSRGVLALTVVGFLIFYLGQRALALQACPHGDCEADRHLGRMSALGLIAHSTIDGASIAAATLISWKVGLIVAAAQRLQAQGIAVRCVSMPSWELFDTLPQPERDAVLPPQVRARLAVEAGVAQGWHRYVGAAGDVMSVERFGASAPAEVLLREYGFSVDNVYARAKALLTK